MVDADPAAAWTRRAPDGTALYVHLPFCETKCPYCDFFSLPAEGRDLAGTVEAILAEAGLRAPRDPRTVFVGGGTPSLLPPDLQGRFWNGLDEHTRFRASAIEVTSECNPESLDRDRAELLLELGVTRLSIGVQAVRDEVLAGLGRVHDAARALGAVEDARGAGASELSIDLIYGSPGHGPEAWAEDLARVLELRPEHLSAYNLTFEEGTPFAGALAAGRLQRWPEEIELELFRITRELTSAAGLPGYEISNYAPSGHECRHNLVYWHNEDYVGLGPSAASHVAGARFANPRSLSAWRRSLSGRRRPLSRREEVEWAAPEMAYAERLGPRARLGETWWLGLRLEEGVDPAAARARAGWGEARDPALVLAEDLAAEGLLEERAGRYRLTAAGLPLADAVAARFLAPDA